MAHDVIIPNVTIHDRLHSGGSRNFERGVQQVGCHIHSAPPKAVRRAEKWRSVRAKRGKIFLRVLFSDLEALVASLRILDMFPDAKKILTK